MDTQAQRRLGTLLVLASCIPFALSGVFTKTISADIWTVLAWRGVLGGLVIGLYAWRIEARLRMDRRAWVLMAIGTLGGAAFLAAFRFAPVANVALIYATAPFIAAGLTWLLGEPSGGRGVLGAAAVSLLGVALVAGGAGGGYLWGNLLALAMTALMALSMALVRRSPGVPALKAMALAGVPMALVGLGLGTPLAVSGRDAMLMIAFAATFALSVILVTEGARRLPAAQVVLLGGAEIPLALALAALLLDEIPAMATLAGGALVIAAVLWQARIEMRPPGNHPAQ